MRRKIIVSSFPVPIKENPYQTLLYKSLRDYDVELYTKNIFSYKDLVKFRKKIDIIHFHWLFDQTDSLKRLIEFLVKLFEAKILGYGIVWTIHNIEHHEYKTKCDWIGRFFLAHLSNALIVHGESVRKDVEKIFRIRDKIWVIPHGNYIDFYPNTIERNEARKRLCIDEGSFVYLFFGLIRPYKGLENLVKSFSQMSGNNLLLIVGKPMDEKIKHKIERITKNNNNIRLHMEHIPVEDVQVFLNVTDVVVLPFTKITASGSVMLALSFGKPIISVNKGVIPEIVMGDIGILIHSPNELSVAMEKIKSMNLKDMGEKALKRARDFDRENIARAHRRIYEFSLIQRIEITSLKLLRQRVDKN